MQKINADLIERNNEQYEIRQALLQDYLDLIYNYKPWKTGELISEAWIARNGKPL